MRIQLSAGLGLAAGLLTAAAFISFAGPLDPPAGPISPTFKTLTEVEPRIAINAVNTPGDIDSTFRISQPGSYYLTSNLAGQAGKHGIEIAASDVTVDLGGFHLAGVTGTLAGVTSSSSFESVSVMNGTVRGWEREGVALQGGTSVIERIVAVGNGLEGIDGGTNCLIRSCIARQNGTFGILGSTSSVIVDCTASGNTLDGINANSRSVVRSCTAEGNQGDGITGVFGAIIQDCAAGSNSDNGISVTQGCQVVRCIVSTNGASGIVAQADALILNIPADGNGTIVASAGILITSSDCRVEGNTCTDNDIGIRVTAAGNFITRNTCSGNGTLNWDVDANNICLVVQATPAPAISGNAGGAAPGSTDPNANYTY